MALIIPTPNEPITINGLMTPTWYRFLQDLARATNSVLTGQYTGDGTEGQVVNFSGNFTPKYVRIWIPAPNDGDGGEVWETTDTIMEADEDGHAFVLYQDGGAQYEGYHRLIALGQGTFTVSDDGGDEHPNEDETVYDYMVIG